MTQVAPANESMSREAKPEDTVYAVAKFLNITPVQYNTPTFVREQVRWHQHLVQAALLLPAVVTKPSSQARCIDMFESDSDVMSVSTPRKAGC